MRTGGAPFARRRISQITLDRLQPADRKTLQLARVGEENTAIAEWDIEKAVQARFHAQIDDLQRFYSDNEGEPRDIIQKLRPILEGYCRNLYPTQFTEQHTLGVIAGAIRAAGATIHYFRLATIWMSLTCIAGGITMGRIPRPQSNRSSTRSCRDM